MTPKGPKEERETTINFNEKDGEVSIWTASSVTYRHLLKRLGRTYMVEDKDHHAVFICPREFLQLPRVKTKRTLSPTHLAKLAASRAKTSQIVKDSEEKRHA